MLLGFSNDRGYNNIKVSELLNNVQLNPIYVLVLLASSTKNNTKHLDTLFSISFYVHQLLILSIKFFGVHSDPSRK